MAVSSKKRCAHFPIMIVLMPLLAVSISTSDAQQTGFFSTDGTSIVDGSGNPVVMRGVGLGGWLMQEGYMIDINTPSGGSPSSIRAQIEDLIGPADTDEFYRIYLENYVNEKDIAAIASWGYDHIRLPFHYNVLYDLETSSFKEDGFAIVDEFLEWCRTHGLYVILDMHALPGAQNDGPISDSDGEARLWTEPGTYQPHAIKLWKEIATRY
ncbi:MAG: cellulase family glycosylhydrolase, partial [Rhodothermales bacterium]|nr:cellulase family glycosylhydrolase [Rhodothermales bacterium]